MARRGRSTLLVALLVAVSTVGGINVLAAASAAASSCYGWSRSLAEGDSGSDVAELQIRVAGWVDYGETLSVDGAFGPATAAAVRRFQSAYGLGADGVASEQTLAKIGELEADDCSTAHFSWAEFDDACFGGFGGGALAEDETRSNTRRQMWKAEALRHKLGDVPLYVTSAFRGYECNASVGGAADSQHLYGNSIDFVADAVSLCDIALQARYAGFSGIFGPGYPGHDDHTHADSRADRGVGAYWSAPACGI